MYEFAHEKLEVYRTALAFVETTVAIIEALPKGYRHLADQLDRASMSIVLNVAEGAGEFAPAEKARFYRIARRSGNECCAILDILRVRDAGDDGRLARGREQLGAVVSMLTRMVVNCSQR